MIDSFVESLAHGIDSLISGSGGHGAHGEQGFLHKWFSLHEWVEYVGKWMISRTLFLIAVYIPLLVVAATLMPGFPSLVWGWVLLTLPITGTIGLIAGFWAAWVWYVRSYFIYMRTGPTLLEVKMPVEITKSPRAMELVFMNLWIRSSETTFIDRYWGGGVRPYFSFELASFGGEIHFFIWTRRGFKNIVESNFYAQYPDVEITEVEDYASHFQYDRHKHECFVTDYVFESNHVDRRDERINAFPIRTYVDYELDKDPKEEFKVEPFAQVLEVLSTMNKDEQIWVQIVMRAHLIKRWKEIVEAEVKEIRKQASVSPAKEDAPESDEKKYGFPRPTWKETELMKSMERNLGKLPFEFGARGIYIAPRGKMRSAEYTAFRWIFRPFANPNYMVMLRPRNAHNDFDYPWQDFRGIRWEHETHRWLDAYRRRQVFHPPWENRGFNITSVEVLATIWHPPSRTIQTPGLQRIPSAKSQPPPNLPI